MNLNKYLDISSAVIINLKTRPEKRAYMEKQLQGQNIKYDFFTAEKFKTNFPNEKAKIITSIAAKK
jgi:hypothetical protein